MGYNRQVSTERRETRSQDVELAHDGGQDQGQLKSEQGTGVSAAAAGDAPAQVVHAVLQASHLHPLYNDKA